MATESGGAVTAWLRERAQSKWVHYCWLLGFVCTGRRMP